MTREALREEEVAGRAVQVRDGRVPEGMKWVKAREVGDVIMMVNR